MYLKKVIKYFPDLLAVLYNAFARMPFERISRRSEIAYYSIRHRSYQWLFLLLFKFVHQTVEGSEALFKTMT